MVNTQTIMQRSSKCFIHTLAHSIEGSNDMQLFFSMRWIAAIWYLQTIQCSIHTLAHSIEGSNDMHLFFSMRWDRTNMVSTDEFNAPYITSSLHRRQQ